MSRKHQTEYRSALKAAKTEFDRLILERVELDKRIGQLKQAMAGLTTFCDGEPRTKRSLNHTVPVPPRFMRLTNAIRQALAESTAPLRPPVLRDVLQKHGLSLTQYSNKLAVIHNTLTRLKRQGETIEVDDGWTLTEKGRLASQKDAFDFRPLLPPEADANGARSKPRAEGEGTRTFGTGGKR